MSTHPALVFVPSLGTTSRLFDDLARELAVRRPRAGLTFVDLPGHGDGARAASVSIEGLADDLVAGLSVPSVIIGVSMGGAIALEAARRHPEAAAAYVQINSGVRFGSTQGWLDLISAVRRAGTGGLAASSAAGWFAESFRESPEAQALVADLEGLDDESYIACCRALASYDGDRDLGKLTVPALLIGTADDRGTPSAAMRDVASRLGRATFIELADGGHLSVAEHSGQVATIIADWLKTINMEKP